MKPESSLPAARASPARAAEIVRTAGSSRSWILAGFLFIHMLLHVDRTVMSVLLEPVRLEFALADTYLGLFSLAFAIAFGVAGLPLGRLADQASRRRVLAGCIGFFSMATAVCGLTQNAIQLLMARFAVGAGEAGARPPMLSMLSDLYPPDRRAFATSIYYLGVPIASILTFLFGGWLADLFGWRLVFLGAGVPGLLAAMVTLFFLREPARGASDTGSVDSSLTWGVSIRAVFGSAAMRHVLAMIVLIALVVSGLGAFGVSFLVRSHGLSLTEAGTIMALCMGGAGAAGALSGGWTVDRISRHDVRWRAWAPGVATLVALCAAAVFTLAPSIAVAAVALGAWGFATNWIYAPAIALTQSLAPPRARATSAAIYYFLSNVAGYGFGPVLVGVLSDAFRPEFGADSVRIAVLALLFVYAWAGLHLFLAGRLLAKGDMH